MNTNRKIKRTCNKGHDVHGQYNFCFQFLDHLDIITLPHFADNELAGRNRAMKVS